MDWAIHHCHGPVGDLHAMVPPEARRSVWTMAGDDDSLVLGSTQDVALIDTGACETAGVGIVKRHSGGGAVLLRSGEYRWVDVVVPVDDPLWDDDVTRSFEWLAEVWLAALRAAGHRVRRHRGATRFRSEGRIACFAGWSPGEIIADDQKLVGMSQRRTRDVARYQCVFHHRYRSSDLLGLLAGPVRDERLAARLDRVGVVDDPDAVVDAFLTLLP
jgi:lipoate-protein ligase A